MPKQTEYSKEQLRVIKCHRCGLTNYVDMRIVHAEDGDPFQWHCTYCTVNLP